MILIHGLGTFNGCNTILQNFLGKALFGPDFSRVKKLYPPAPLSGLSIGFVEVEIFLILKIYIYIYIYICIYKYKYICIYTNIYTDIYEDISI